MGNDLSSSSLLTRVEIEINRGQDKKKGKKRRKKSRSPPHRAARLDRGFEQVRNRQSLPLLFVSISRGWDWLGFGRR